MGRRALCAIDGVGGSGKTTFAARLAQRIDSRPVVVLHADDFFHPSAVRHARGRYSPEGFWLDTYNYDALVTWALAPLRAGQPYRASSFDPVRDEVMRPEAIPAAHDALVLVEGTFLHRDELVTLWDWSAYLYVSTEEASRRMARRAGSSPDPRVLRRYDGAQRIYAAAAKPQERASLVVDNSDLGDPRIIDVPGDDVVA
ncbi:uridine kinase [Cellulomonas sp.]|uniref:uridine kinase n=1 Tax=Cellulomonas sp. TaxID=40001 RepID=UPI003BA8A333